MRVVPVLDLKGGIVVHARRGDRAHYAALESPLAATAAPADVLDGLLALLPFDTVYIADLDAIGGSGDHVDTVRALAKRHPRLGILLDAGFDSPAKLAPYLGVASVDFVFGTESLPSLARYAELSAVASPARTVLSLDRSDAGPLGCDELFATPACWPARIIHMDLTRVGTARGPDWHGLAELRARCGERALYAAGGVRDEQDLERLARLGAAGVLVASALHDGRIKRHEI